MFIMRLLCKDCDFCTHDFVNGYSLQSDTYFFVYQHAYTHHIRIAEITKDEIAQRNIDPQAAEFYEIAKRSYALENEVDIKFLSWGEDEQLNIPCPQCGAPYLFKQIRGIE